MLVKFIEQILKKRDVTAYRLARDLNLPPNQIIQWQGKTKGREAQKGLRLDYLCRLREYSGMTWEELGKLLDKEYLSK